jgi:serine/threonine protein kinase
MKKTVTVKTAEGKSYQYVDDGSPMQGGLKDVYFSPDKSYVVAFFRDPQDFNAKDRLANIVKRYRESIFNQAGGDYWKNLYCWPYDMVEHDSRLGIIVPAYDSCFFFQKGFNQGAANFSSIKGEEKQGKWFAAPQYRNKDYKLHLDPSELGDWGKFIRICLNISRAVRRMHAAGLAHSDLSYRNVLIDPVTGRASIIDIDGLVVPGRFPPDVLGTPDFIAPEVIATMHLDRKDSNRKLPSMQTDRYALAVMIYMYLLYRHPLRGGKFHDADPQKDEELTMGKNALFIEHPTDTSNRPKLSHIRPTHLPWADITKVPYKVCGPYLMQLFDRAFIDGLHNPSARPTAQDWEDALIKTVDLMQPCQNPKCEQKWFVFDNTTTPKCPFCGSLYKGQLPVLDLYYAPTQGNFRLENHRIMVYSGQNIYQWHIDRNITPNERLTEEQRKAVGDFHFHNGKWILINRNMPTLKDITEQKDIPIGTPVELADNKQILLSKEPGGRLINIKIVNN